MSAFPAVFEKNEDGGYVVQFIDIPGCLTEGDTLAAAKEMAGDALAGVLLSMAKRGVTIPKPSVSVREDVQYIQPRETSRLYSELAETIVAEPAVTYAGV